MTTRGIKKKCILKQVTKVDVFWARNLICKVWKAINLRIYYKYLFFLFEVLLFDMDGAFGKCSKTKYVSSYK